MKTEDARSWGYLALDGLIVAVGFADLGIEPQYADTGSVIAIGIDELIVGIDPERREIVFQYRMPTVFHEFLRADRCGFLVRDEAGFVWLSLEGEELWSFSADDIVETFTIVGRSISGRTLGGLLFDAQIPVDLEPAVSK